MSGQSTNPPKTTAMALPGVPAVDSLPPEVLETMFGFLEARTLCTARLVCAQFRASASRCIRSVELSAETLRCRPATTLNSFPTLSQLTVFDVNQKDLVMLAQSPVADAVTHLRADEYFGQVPRHAQIVAGFPQQPLPNLTSLTVRSMRRVAPLLLQTLRELSIKDDVDSRIANLVAGLTNLTSLRIDVQAVREPFEAVTALTALQRLEICGGMSLVPFVAELTLLTHLQLLGGYWPAKRSDLAPLASLARLHRLAHLGFEGFDGVLERHILASMAAFTSLRSLVLQLGGGPKRSAFETLCMAPFSQLTALKLAYQELDASFLPRFNVDMLRDLRLSQRVKLNRDGVAALGRATHLTQLDVWTATVGPRVGPEEWEAALSRMSGLRALSLGATNASEEATGALQAVALLTELTRLGLNGGGAATNAGAKVCLGLKKLRVLSMAVGYLFPAPSDSDCITPETVFAIAKLPELCRFDILGIVGISDQDWDLRDEVRVGLNAERHEKGWPPLQLGFNARFCG